MDKLRDLHIKHTPVAIVVNTFRIFTKTTTKARYHVITIVIAVQKITAVERGICGIKRGRGPAIKAPPTETF